MRYHSIYSSLINGEGIRAVLWVAGCNHFCKGCHNTVTWDPKGGVLFDVEARHRLLSCVGRKSCDGVTFSGGDPLYPDNREEITALAKDIKELYPNKTIWLYTGFSYEEVCDLEVMQYVDVLVDGRFVEELKDENYKYAGSTNQRIIDVKESRKHGSIKKYL
jgi:anaerobic ribonucleoside-triphosphate reductase activating protein